MVETTLSQPHRIPVFREQHHGDPTLVGHMSPFEAHCMAPAGSIKWVRRHGDRAVLRAYIACDRPGNGTQSPRVIDYSSRGTAYRQQLLGGHVWALRGVRGGK